jgi:hypothetical protein
MKTKTVAARLYGVTSQTIVIIVAYVSLQMAVSKKTEGFSLYREKYAQCMKCVSFTDGNIKTLDYKHNGCWKTDMEEDKEIFLCQTKDARSLLRRLRCPCVTWVDVEETLSLRSSLTYYLTESDQPSCWSGGDKMIALWIITKKQTNLTVQIILF